MCDNKYLNILIKNAMETLHKVRIHSINVKTKEEARNFIMYHIDIGTVVTLDSSLEDMDLKLEKSIIEKGGNIADSNFNNTIINELKHRKGSIDEIHLCGESYMLSKKHIILSRHFNDNFINKKNHGKKMIVVILINTNEVETIGNIFEDIELIKDNDINQKYIIDKNNNELDEIYSCNEENKFLRQESINSDISVVFVG